ncbi:hypothetical protein B0H14DRAFT_3131503 [Mycena olivaceomarginata]|nr:hypothetical protein B0H14DRAFT_3131503 [Mycena olivaceomarginata]
MFLGIPTGFPRVSPRSPPPSQGEVHWAAPKILGGKPWTLSANLSDECTAFSRRQRRENAPHDMATPFQQREESHTNFSAPCNAITMIPYDVTAGHLGDWDNRSVATIRNHRPIHPYSISPNTFHGVGGNMPQLTGLDLLFRFIAMGAAHNSGEVFRDPACHPGTRVAVLEQLSRWAIGARPESMVLWLRGPPGVGKSATAQMFAGMCHKDERLGGSFFFKSGHPERGSWDKDLESISKGKISYK